MDLGCFSLSLSLNDDDVYSEEAKKRKRRTNFPYLILHCSFKCGRDTIIKMRRKNKTTDGLINKYASASSFTQYHPV